MERREFFKSFGLLSLAAVAPKFLFGKEKESIKVNDIQVKEDKTVMFSDSVVGIKQPDGTYRHLYNSSLASMDDNKAIVKDHLGNLKSYDLPNKELKYIWDRSPEGIITVLTYHPMFESPLELFTSEDVDALNKLAKDNPLPKFTKSSYDSGWAYKCTADRNNLLKSRIKI